MTCFLAVEPEKQIPDDTSLQQRLKKKRKTHEVPLKY